MLCAKSTDFFQQESTLMLGTLAMLDHESNAKVLDGGATDRYASELSVEQRSGWKIERCRRVAGG